jgi:RES domain-containing protein
VPAAWRLVKHRYLAQAWDGEGARQYGGRWNSPGVSVVYASETLALALLEVLVRLQSTRVLHGYSAIRCEFDEALMRSVDVAGLPAGWERSPAPPELAAVGDEWTASAASPILRVPSAIVPLEHNYLVNPHHPQFGAIRLGEATPFPIDPRLR